MMGKLSGLLGFGGSGGGGDQAAELAAQRHHQLMTMLALGGQGRGIGGQGMMQHMAKQSRRLSRMEKDLKRKRRNRRRRRREMMMLRHDPYFSAAPPRRFSREAANRVYPAPKYYW